MPRWKGHSEFCLGKVGDGSEVVVRQNTDHIRVDSMLLQEALDHIQTNQIPKTGMQVFTYNFGEQVGWCEVVETDSDDMVCYAPRTDTSGLGRIDTRTNKVRWTRWVMGVEKQPAYHVTYGLLRSNTDPNVLVMIFAYFGEPIHLEPGDPRATDVNRLWWYNPRTGKGHAFVAPFVFSEETTQVPEEFMISKD